MSIKSDNSQERPTGPETNFNIDQKLDESEGLLTAWSSLLESADAVKAETAQLHNMYKKKLHQHLSFLAKLVDKQVRPNRNVSSRTTTSSINNPTTGNIINLTAPDILPVFTTQQNNSTVQSQSGSSTRSIGILPTNVNSAQGGRVSQVISGGVPSIAPMPGSTSAVPPLSSLPPQQLTTGAHSTSTGQSATISSENPSAWPRPTFWTTGIPNMSPQFSAYNPSSSLPSQYAMRGMGVGMSVVQSVGMSMNMSGQLQSGKDMGAMFANPLGSASFPSSSSLPADTVSISGLGAVSQASTSGQHPSNAQVAQTHPSSSPSNPNLNSKPTPSTSNQSALPLSTISVTPNLASYAQGPSAPPPLGLPSNYSSTSSSALQPIQLQPMYTLPLQPLQPPSQSQNSLTQMSVPVATTVATSAPGYTSSHPFPSSFTSDEKRQKTEGPLPGSTASLSTAAFGLTGSSVPIMMPVPAPKAATEGIASSTAGGSITQPQS